MYIQKNNFMIDCKKIDKSYVNSLDFCGIYNKVNDFFRYNKKICVKMKFLYSIEEYNFFSILKFERWHCGFTLENDLLFIFSPSVIERLTIHKKEEIPKIMIHELSHIFYHNIGLPRSAIIDEGIATYLGFYEEHIAMLKKRKLFKINLKKPKDKRDIYHRGFLVINEIIKNNKKSEFLAFLKGLKNMEDFEQKLKEKLISWGIL